MKFYFVLIFGFALLSNLSLNAQNRTPYPSPVPKNRNDLTEMLNRALDETLRFDKPDTYEGSQFLYEEFKPATLYFPNGESLEANIRYNVVTEEMQVLFPPESFRVLHPDIIVGIDNDLFRKYSYLGEDKSAKLVGYFQVLTDDYQDKNLILLLKNYKEIEPGKPAKAMIPATYPGYENESDYYLKFADSNFAVLLEKRKSNFIEQFPKAHREMLEDFIDKNNLRPRREEDLPEIIEYYNQTLSQNNS